MADPWRPKSLSPLRLSPIQYSPRECIAPGSSDEDSPETWIGKKRKRELLGEQYLRGRPPTILTASLRGPCDDGWKNPWAKKKLGHEKCNKLDKNSSGGIALSSTRRVQINKERRPVEYQYMENVEEDEERGSFDYVPKRSRQDSPRASTISESSQQEKDYFSEERGTTDDDNYKLVNMSRRRNYGRDSITARLAKVAQQSEDRSDSSTLTPTSRGPSIRKPLGPYHTRLQQRVKRANRMTVQPIDSAIKEVYRMKDTLLREQTLAFCKAAQGIAKGVDSLFPQSRPTSNSYIQNQNLCTDTNRRLKATKQSTNSAFLKDRNGDQANRMENRDDFHDMLKSASRSKNRYLPSTIDVPHDFFVQPLQGILHIAEMAQKLNEEMLRLAKNTMPERSLAPTSTKKNIARSRPEASSKNDPRKSPTISKILSFTSSREIPPSTTLPAFRYRRVMKASSTSPLRPRLTSEKTIAAHASSRKDHDFSSTKKSTDIDSGTAFKADHKKPRRMSFSASGRMMLEVRVPLKPSNECPRNVSQKAPTTYEILPEAQVVSEPPGQKAQLPSWPSTNMLESLQSKSTEEGNSEVALSTQAALNKAHRAFQLELDSPNKLWSSSPEPSQHKNSQLRPEVKYRGTPFRFTDSPHPISRSQQFEADEEPVNTQVLVDKLTPFVITTIKKHSPIIRPVLDDSPLKRKTIPKSASNKDGGDTECFKSNIQNAFEEFDIEYNPSMNKTMNSPPCTIDPRVLSLGTFSQHGNQRSPEGPPDQPVVLKQTSKSPSIKSPVVFIPRPRKFQHSASSPIRRGQPRSSQAPRTHFSSPTNSSQFLPTRPTQSSSQGLSPSRTRTLRSFRSTLSGTTPYQDGQLQQQMQPIGGWSLDDAIEDAGSFLGTWDLEKEVRKGRISGSSGSSKNLFRTASEGKSSRSRQ